MKQIPASLNEKAASAAFSRQAPVFDTLYSGDTIIDYKRKRVREHIGQFLSPSSRILELNAGTGEDAIYFAKQGHHVNATDISEKMMEMLASKVAKLEFSDHISHELCSYTELEQLRDQGPYDHIFSNFAGLNCTNQLDKVFASFNPLLKPGGHVTLVILPRFSLWEFLTLFKGKFKTAFRRFAGKKGAKARVEGAYFRCWYYNPSYVKRELKSSFKVKKLEGLCTIVPPSYIEHFAEKHPRLYRFLIKAENKLKSSWPWRSIGDYYIITLHKANS